MFRLIFISFSFLQFSVYGQYNPFPKLENLYNKGEYEKCIEKATEIIGSQAGNGELYPYVWQMKSYLEIDNLESHSLKKNALKNALTIALKIKKKDKEAKLLVLLNLDFKNIIYKQLKLAESLCTSNVEKAHDIYTKLTELKPLNSIKYEKYKCLKSKNFTGIDILLKELVVGNYQHFKNKDALFENLDTAYADLILIYFEINKISLVDEVLKKAQFVYVKSTLCKNTIISYLSAITNEQSYSTNTNEILNNIHIHNYYDSTLHSSQLKANIQILNGYLFKNYLINEPENSPQLKLITSSYFDNFGLNKADTLDRKMYEILKNELTSKSPEITSEKKYLVWINSHKSLKKQAKAIDVIKDINQFFLNKKLYNEDYDFLQFCQIKYPALKLELKPLVINLNAFITNEIKTTNNIELVNKYAETINSKEIKDKQYVQYTTLLAQLLKDKNYSGFAVNCSKALKYFPNDSKILELKKQYVIEDFKASYLYVEYHNGYDSYFEKKPDISKCEAGIVNKAGQQIVLNTINYVRRLAGVPDSSVLDASLNSKSQKAALIMSANYDLNHSPPKTWKCYTADGALAASSSNLSLGHAFSDAILGEMQDNGGNNYSCGHRRWILNPFNTVFGHGSTNDATALWVFGSGINKKPIYFNENKPVMWPSEDYFPLKFVPARWSFSLNNANFEKVKITVTENGKIIKVNVEKLYQGYGLNTLVWYFNNSAEANKTYTISISNIEVDDGYDSAKNNRKLKTLAFTYKVMPVKIE